MNTSDYWVCNVKKEDLQKLKEFIYSNHYWKNRSNTLHVYGTSTYVKPRLYVHGRNPNRWQFTEKYRGCYTGTKNLRVEDASYFGVYINERCLSAVMKQEILEKFLTIL